MTPQYRKGIVTEVNGAKGLARVELQDQDGVVSWWLNVNQQVASASKSYSMPEVGAQVNVLTDERGEEGVILGSFYSDIDTPPTDNPNQIVNNMRGGRVETYDKDSGEYTVNQTAPYVIEIGSARVEITNDQISLTVGGTGIVIGAGGTVQSTGDFSHKGNAKFENGTLRHNDKNVGSDHTHSGVEPGGGNSSTPLP